MSIILGIDIIHSDLTEADLSSLDKAAEKQQSQSNITFTVLQAENGVLEIETAQGETKSGKYASEAALITRTKEVFEKFFPGFKMRVNPVTFVPSPASVVTVAWLEKKMLQKGIRIKQIAFETGIDRASVSDWVTGKRSMSQIVKAMFYFYLSK